MLFDEGLVNQTSTAEFKQIGNNLRYKNTKTNIKQLEFIFTFPSKYKKKNLIEENYNLLHNMGEKCSFTWYKTL